MIGHRRCIITRACVFLLLGAIVNVEVAWTLALTVNLYSGPHLRGQRWNNDELWELQKWSDTGGIAWYSARNYVPAVQWEDLGPDPRDFVPKWATLGQAAPRFASRLVVMEVRAVEARGWPMLAMWSETEWFPNTATEVRGGLRTSFGEWQHGGARLPKVLPLRIIWLNFAINTIFYAAILWPLLAAPGWLRRRRRIKRGLCPACAYPVGTSPVCTECGVPIPSPLRGRARVGLGCTDANDAHNDAARSTHPQIPGAASFKGDGTAKPSA